MGRWEAPPGLFAPFVSVALVVAAASFARGDVRTDTGPRVVVGAAEVPLHAATVRAGEDAVLEVCGASLRDGQTPPATLRLGLREGDREVLRLDDTETIGRRRRAGRDYGCVRLAEVQDHPRSSRVALTAAGATAAAGASSEPSVPFVGRLVARAPLPTAGRLLLGLALLLPLLGLVSLTRRADADGESETSPRDAPRAVRTLVVAGLCVGVAMLPLPLPTTPEWLATALRGAPMALGQALPLALASLLLGVSARDALATRSVRPRALAAAVALGLLVLLVGRLLDRLLPADKASTVVALATPSLARVHVEAQLDSALGLVVFSGYALLAPVLEELFFRGLVFGAVESRAGTRVAAAVAFLAFTAGHLAQTEGRLASLLSIGLLSLASTALRVRTGSVLPSVALHAAHNGLVVLVSWLAR